jgi:hypothetical protein
MPKHEADEEQAEPEAPITHPEEIRLEASLTNAGRPTAGGYPDYSGRCDVRRPRRGRDHSVVRGDREGCRKTVAGAALLSRHAARNSCQAGDPSRLGPNKTGAIRTR